MASNNSNIIPDYSRLFTEQFNNNPLWHTLGVALSQLLNDNIQPAINELMRIRYPLISNGEEQVVISGGQSNNSSLNYFTPPLPYPLPGIADSYFSGLNLKAMGFYIPSNNIQFFSDSEYELMMENVGTYLLTSGASNQFINFLAFIKNVNFTYIPLWGNSLSNSPSELVPYSSANTPVWEGGTYFPTPYYDISYNQNSTNITDSANYINYFLTLQPNHLVLRNIIAVQTTNLGVQQAVWFKERTVTTTYIS